MTPPAIPPSSIPCEVTDEQLAAKYAQANPWRKPDPQGDREVVLPSGHVSTAASRAKRRARLAEAWDQGRVNWQQRCAAPRVDPEG